MAHSLLPAPQPQYAFVNSLNDCGVLQGLAVGPPSSGQSSAADTAGNRHRSVAWCQHAPTTKTCMRVREPDTTLTRIPRIRTAGEVRRHASPMLHRYLDLLHTRHWEYIAVETTPYAWLAGDNSQRQQPVGQQEETNTGTIEATISSMERKQGVCSILLVHK